MGAEPVLQTNKILGIFLIRDEQQAGVGQPIERLTQLRLRQIAGGRQKSEPELAADRRAGLRNVLGIVPQAVQPRHERGMQGRRH